MMRFEDVLKVIHGNFSCIVDSKRYNFVSSEDFEDRGMYKNYMVTDIRSEADTLVFELQPWQSPVTDMDAKWSESQKELTGFEATFF